VGAYPARALITASRLVSQFWLSSRCMSNCLRRWR
jgi:hypothetical protein